jgi:hypothetical protein
LIKKITRRETAILIDARRNVPGYDGTVPSWTVKDLARWMGQHLSRDVSESQARGFAHDAGIRLVMRAKTRQKVDSGAKFIGHCLVDFYEAMGVPVPQHLHKWLTHRITLDEAASMRAKVLFSDDSRPQHNEPGEQKTWQM